MYNIFLMMCLFLLSITVDASQSLVFPTNNDQLLEDIKKNAEKYKQEIAAVHSTYRDASKTKQDNFDSIDMSKYVDKDELKNIKDLTEQWAGVVPCWGCLIKRPDLLKVVAATNPNLQIDDTGDTLLTWLCSNDSISYQSQRDKDSGVAFLGDDDRSRVLSILFENKDTDFNQCNHDGKTAFFKACASRALNTIKLLLSLKKSNIDINKPAEEKVTPFQYIVKSCQKVDSHLINLLLCDHRLQVPYEWIFCEGNGSAKRFLFQLIAEEREKNPFITFVIQMNIRGATEENKATVKKVQQEAERKLKADRTTYEEDLRAADTRRREDIDRVRKTTEQEYKTQMKADSDHAENMQKDFFAERQKNSELVIQHGIENKKKDAEITELRELLKKSTGQSKKELQQSKKELQQTINEQWRSINTIKYLLYGSVIANIVLFCCFFRR